MPGRTRKWPWLLGAALVAAVGLYAARHPILVAIAEQLIVDEPRRRADAIVVLGGSLPDRMIEAADLYLAGLAPQVVLGREPSNPGMEELARRGAHIPERDELNVSVARQLGVPDSAIVVLDGRPNSTVIEAEIIVPHLRRMGVRRALLVTSKIHTFRSRMIFRDLAPDLELTVCATRYDPFDTGNWWHSRGNVRRVFFEYQKILVYLLRDRWRI
ncbi:MAG TPA: YdcF family protein [Terriglobales bacterium]|nr:YdcF family protein [Terriglobales bacterium]